ncbi:hypothetical protein [Natronomonas sp. LN261]|uniref:hypothetical protein n=1 Tax=Natronomonas sp. LN261 TaxID=2750669 RepID=UPI0015EECC0A|nr:hypothetical protein [Natronomonas sp. LN261]
MTGEDEKSASEAGADGGSAADAKGSDAGTESGGITRRRMLLGSGASIATLGGGRALYNTVLGYGQFGMGTNLEEQDIAPLATERLVPSYDESIGGTRIRAVGSGLTAEEAGDEAFLRFGTDPVDAAADLDSRLGLEGRFRELFVDLSAFRAGEYAFEFHDPPAFFDRLGGGDVRPEVVTTVRSNWDRVIDPETVGQFADADPSDPPAVVEGLVSGFRDHATYDVPRYLAGSVEDNVILGAADLRRYFEDDVGFEALLESEETGMFCWELVYRSIEALQAVAADRQSVPVAACHVSDGRHKHAYTGILGAIRVGGELRFPMTFVDYTHTTLYDDVGLTGVLGEGLAAYDDGHRADEIYW